LLHISFCYLQPGFGHGLELTLISSSFCQTCWFVLLVLQRRRKNRKGKLEPKVKVESAVVDMATGKTPTNPIGEAEGRVLQALAGFFGILLVEGLLLSGAVSHLRQTLLFRCSSGACREFPASATGKAPPCACAACLLGIQQEPQQDKFTGGLMSFRVMMQMPAVLCCAGTLFKSIDC
jgi:hypothetical protein